MSGWKCRNTEVVIEQAIAGCYHPRQLEWKDTLHTKRSNSEHVFLVDVFGRAKR